MPRIIDRLATDHDWELLLLAGIVCLLASFAALDLLRRAQADTGRRRVLGLLKAGVAAGLGAWVAQALAMLAYDPDVPMAFRGGAVAASALSAVILVGPGLAVPILWRARSAALLGGALVGSGLAAAEYLGTGALDMAAYAVWRRDLLFSLAAVGIVLATTALWVALRTRLPARVPLAAAILTFATLAQHALAVSAVDLIPDPSITPGAGTFSRETLVVFVIAGVLVMLALRLRADVAKLRGSERESLLLRRAAPQGGRDGAEMKLPEQNRRLYTAINNMSQGLCMFDRNGKLLVCNQRYRDIYYLPAELAKPGCSIEELLRYRSQCGLFEGDPDTFVRDLLGSLEHVPTVHRIGELPDGRVISVVNQSMQDGGWVATHEDITEQRRAEQRIAYLAQHDTLTELANRTSFAERLTATLESARASGGSLGLLSIDLDRFKEVNDVFGHAVGDALLREAARRLRDALGDVLIGRLGADEFMVIIADAAQPAASAAAAESIASAFAQEFDIDGHSIPIRVSIGIAVYPNDGNDAPTLLGNAEAALFRAKADERGSIRFFEPDMDLRLRERRAMQHELRAAIGNGELLVHYQPQALMDGTIIGFEALVRWEHPTRGMVSPGTFIPLAEESRLIVPMGEWILREACREAASWPKPLQIAINLSPVQFEQGDLPALVHAVLLETGLSPDRVELEITEGVLIGEFSRALSILRRLKLLGVRIAMDDFGTGYSSLSYLQSFPFDKIKIDRAFISNLESNVQSAAIVRAVIGLAHGLGLPVLAEGVETPEQFALLRAESCDEAQGYLIGRPAPIGRYVEMIGRAPAARAAVG